MKRIFKISGLYIGCMLILLAGFYLLYPWINEDSYQQIVDSHDIADPSFQADRDYIGQEFEDLVSQIEELRASEQHLNRLVDSLTAVNQDLQERLGITDGATSAGVVQVSERSEIADDQRRADRFGLYGAPKEEGGQEEFLEKVKSLLNLDEEELAPIINQMSNQQLIRLYNGGGSLHKEKLLRSLEPERAAAIMTEIML